VITGGGVDGKAGHEKKIIKNGTAPGKRINRVCAIFLLPAPVEKDIILHNGARKVP
jgi:hypothetical protein